MKSSDSKVTETKLSPLHHLSCTRVHLLNVELACAPSVLSTRGNWDCPALQNIKLTQGQSLHCPRKEPPWFLFLHAPTVNHHLSYQKQGINLKFFLYRCSNTLVHSLYSCSVVDLVDLIYSRLTSHHLHLWLFWSNASCCYCCWFIVNSGL